MTCNDLARDNKNFCIMSGGSSMNKETIWIGNDHGGYELKQHIIEYRRGISLTRMLGHIPMK